MENLELVAVLEEHGINVPDRCISCSRLGRLASVLSQAQENRNFLITSTDTEVLTANIRSQLTAQIKERYPDVSDEQVTVTVNNSITNFLSSERYGASLKDAGLNLEQEDATIATSTLEITNLLVVCPPEGCGPNL